MAISITHTMSNSQFENKENLKNIAKKILQRHGASEESTNKIINKTIFNNRFNQNTQMMQLNTASYLIMQKSIKETAKYLKNNKSVNNKKTYVFGELRQMFESSSFNENENVLNNFEVDLSAKNIFIAA